MCAILGRDVGAIVEKGANATEGVLGEPNF